MKKLLSIALALGLLVSLCCSPVSALTGYDNAGDIPETNVSVQISTGINVVNKYAADIEYPTEMVFTYGATQTWIPDSHSYREEAGSGWSEAKSITVVNHSDLALRYTAAASVTNNSYGTLGIDLTNSSATLGACTEGMTSNFPSASLTVAVSGTPNNTLTATKVTLGSVNISFSNG